MDSVVVEICLLIYSWHIENQFVGTVVVEHVGVGKLSVSEEKNIAAERSFWCLSGNIDLESGLRHGLILHCDSLETFA